MLLSHYIVEKIRFFVKLYQIHTDIPLFPFQIMLQTLSSAESWCIAETVLTTWSHLPSSSSSLKLGSTAFTGITAALFGFGIITKVKVPVIWHKVSQISWTDFPLSFNPLTSKTSSPGCSWPLLSAAPPFTTRPITTRSPSFRTVAPWNKDNEVLEGALLFTQIY